ncbi:hypothetical protein EJ02DRAFT_466450 [Clathrospora elynae]|uniref:Zn(2)-C6 fungal-type domain-containing protein n=1 Tax=Clathrospora elynae TaxID=706981 RepID=A0A6A5SLW8_9PLEO|nr:hypothetical protein EJ02DRAFT_466450 [Clathrospora elynae]
MPPKSQRSRACSQCRTRRVKCDETSETCNQFRRLGLMCSGPVQGTVIIDMAEQVVKPRGRKKKKSTRALIAIREKGGCGPVVSLSPRHAEHPNLSTAVDMSVPNSMFPIGRRYTEHVEQAITAICYQYRPPRFHQPSRALLKARDTAFLTHCAELSQGTRTYTPQLQWLAQMHKTHSNADKPAVGLFFRAVSMAFYGKLHQDPSILVDP